MGEIIEGWRGVMVHVGLGTPMRRFVAATLATGLVSYTFKVPRAAFRQDGSPRPAAQFSGARDATAWHFLLTPLLVGAAVGLCT